MAIWRVVQVVVLAALLPLCTGCFFAARQGVKALRGDKPAAPAVCDGTMLPPGMPAGVDGPYALVQHTVRNAATGREVQVFLPAQAPGPSPVILFAHGFGADRWTLYEGLIRHLVSRGAVVVFAPYPTLDATQDQRYGALWDGFTAAVVAEGAAMDLTRVGVIGHSFGGGAVPFLASRAFVDRGWGSRGGFILMLAPWYSYGTSDNDLAHLPSWILRGWQVYDSDTVNDQRMAADLYAHTPPTAGRYFFQANSGTVSLPKGAACPLTADHRTPVQGNSPLLQRLAVYPVVDALADQAFTPSADTAAKLAALGHQGDGGYHPLVREDTPAPAKAQDAYRWPWTHPRNPRQGPRQGEGLP
ncbi:hypothetical protein FBZ89_1342 [Nitrospirillum amazonense]|uniref:Alpha/beta hydrolase family protein n=1 Tax=Nitrospirillum amazonense TaxID=28077 RepID=A0A560EM77_9PROT|nr:alpha/beta hydrolase [Nitrospirillum amazonense]TWB10478.1 hypothetical protein FBZ89_1342 [Nitrospirillum amazonense]